MWRLFRRTCCFHLRVRRIRHNKRLARSRQDTEFQAFRKLLFAVEARVRFQRRQPTWKNYENSKFHEVNS
jgi:hypothetical protein